MEGLDEQDRVKPHSGHMTIAGMCSTIFCFQMKAAVPNTLK